MHVEELSFWIPFFCSFNCNFNQWWQIITGIIWKKVVMRAGDGERMVNYEWPNLSTNSEVYWSFYCLNFYLSTLLQSWWEKLNMPLRLVLVYFIIGYTVHSLQFSSPGWCSALLFWFYIFKCVRHYPIEILHNWHSVPNPSKDSPIWLTSPLSFFRFCPTLFNPSLLVALFLWLNLSSCYI